MKQSNWKTTFQWKQNLHRKYTYRSLKCNLNKLLYDLFRFQCFDRNHRSESGYSNLPMGNESQMDVNKRRASMASANNNNFSYDLHQTKQNPPQAATKIISKVSGTLTMDSLCARNNVALRLLEKFYSKPFFKELPFLSFLKRYTIFLTPYRSMGSSKKFLRKKVYICFIIQYSWRS